jgi:ribosomal protein S6--L-glutamate ligase
VTTNFMLGWEEWLAMPDIGVPAIKAKVDTGARTSALHAFMIQEIGSEDRPRVRFGIHPIPGREDVAVVAEADVVDRREVTSSNGERELRWVITTRVKMGDREWPIEVTLANRETMAYRMLLGRQAILDDMLVDATSSFHQPRLDDGVYSPQPREPEPNRPLTIALLTRRPENTTNRRLVRAAERRGHEVVVVDRTRVSLWVDAREPALFVDGHPIARLDAAVVRVGRTIGHLTLAVARQMELIGAYCVPSAAALALLGDPLAMRQALARHRLPIPEVAVSHSDFVGAARGENPVLADSLGPLRTGALLRFAVVGARAFGALERPAATALEPEPHWQTPDPEVDTRDARALAETAAKSLGIGLAAIDIARTHQGPIIVEVSAGLAVAEFERLADVAIIEALIVHIEQEARVRAVARS